MIVDSAPIRKQAREDYQQVLLHLNEARSELERFETEDKPGFLRWMNAHFGGLITELRETNRTLLAKRDLLFEIETESFFCGISLEQAYHRVTARQEKLDSEEEGDDDPFKEFDDFTNSGDSPGSDESDDPFEPHNQTRRRKKRRTGAQASDKPGKSVDRVKELYRALVRRLHPDTHAEPNRQKLEWWHQVQKAYEAGDTDQLEIILTLCEMAEKGAAAETSVSLLTRITRQFRSSLRSLKQQLAKHRRDPAWNFSKLTNFKPLASRLQRELETELFGMKWKLKRLECQLQEIAEAARRLGRRARRRRSYSSQSEFGF